MTHTDGHIGVGTRGAKLNPEYLNISALQLLWILKRKITSQRTQSTLKNERDEGIDQHLEPFNRPYGNDSRARSCSSRQIDIQIASLKAHILAGYAGKKKPRTYERLAKEKE